MLTLCLLVLETQASSSAKERSYSLFLEAEKAYQAGEVERAVPLLEEAYRLSPQPVLLFNLARAHETLGRLEEALATYREYLTAEPNTPDRGAIEARVVVLEAQIGRTARERQERARLERELKLAPTTPSKRWVGWVVGGAGVVGLVTAGVLKGLAFGARDEAVNDPFQRSAVETFGRAKSLDTASTSTFVVGAAVLAVGLAIWIFVDAVGRSPAAPDQEPAT